MAALSYHSHTALIPLSYRSLTLFNAADAFFSFSIRIEDDEIVENMTMQGPLVAEPQQQQQQEEKNCVIQ